MPEGKSLRWVILAGGAVAALGQWPIWSSCLAAPWCILPALFQDLSVSRRLMWPVVTFPFLGSTLEWLESWLIKDTQSLFSVLHNALGALFGYLEKKLGLCSRATPPMLSEWCYPWVITHVGRADLWASLEMGCWSAQTAPYCEFCWSVSNLSWLFWKFCHRLSSGSWWMRNPNFGTWHPATSPAYLPYQAFLVFCLSLPVQSSLSLWAKLT